jgi:predicted dehydrogenase
MPIRIGFVGTGGIANTHFDALSQLEEAQLVAFCDIDSARAERAAARFSGRAYTDWRTMLDAESIDALYICLPPYAHDGVEIEAAQRGVHLFVEKPVARDLGLRPPRRGSHPQSGRHLLGRLPLPLLRRD